MTRIDPHSWIGGYPWRHLPSSDMNSLLAALEREGLVGAWVGHLPSAWWRDPALGNRDLVALLAPHRERLTPAPCVRPGWPRWRDEIARAVDVGAAAVRAYPAIVQLGPEDSDWIALGDEVARAGLALILTQRFEDLRQRHPLDTCFAVYKQLFKDAYPFSYDLEELARYYVAHHRLIEHWQQAMPSNWPCSMTWQLPTN